MAVAAKDPRLKIVCNADSTSKAANLNAVLPLVETESAIILDADHHIDSHFVPVIVSALALAWNHAKKVRVTARTTPDGRKIYDVEGTLLFASAQNFLEQFNPRLDADDVEIDFRNARLFDHSAVEAVNSLAERYHRLDKQLKLRHLSHDCLELLDKARAMIVVDYREDPHYRIADDKLA